MQGFLFFCLRDGLDFFRRETGGRNPREQGQVALTVGGASVSVVTYVVVAVWFCQCFAPSSDRSDDDLLVSLCRGLLSVMTQFGNWVIYG